MLTPPPLALYVHLPWCVRKCPYCDFNSHPAPALIPQAQYVDALLDDLAIDAPAAAGRPLTSVFFGGGTPSLFSPEEIARFLEGARDRIAFAADVEITLEANPGAIEHARFAGYRDAGVNRVSLGVQSFSSTQLQTLGRIHGADEIARAVEELRSARLLNFNLDLMYALPAQTTDEAVADLEAALALSPAHLSHYQLTLEPGTVFYHRPPQLPDAEVAWEMQVECQARLARAGFAQYEVSAYALPGRECRHNLNYWRFGDYIGVGAGAHGKLTREAWIERTIRKKQPREYLTATGGAQMLERVRIDPAELPFEFMLNALRLNDGFDCASFEQRTGLRLDSIAPTLQSALQRGLLERQGAERWRPTELGRRFLNDLQELFLPASGAGQRVGELRAAPPARASS